MDELIALLRNSTPAVIDAVCAEIRSQGEYGYESDSEQEGFDDTVSNTLVKLSQAVRKAYVEVTK